MSERCPVHRDRLPAFVHGELPPAEHDEVRRHLRECDECRELSELISDIDGTIALARGALQPPPGLLQRLDRPPCERWLGLLFQAVDRSLSTDGLEHLMGHLESCPACRRAWEDLTLVRQVGDALEPPSHLAAACSTVHRRPVRRTVIGRRFATAAAYVLAVLTSFALGNPVTTARMPTTETVQRVAATVTAEVEEVAADGRGELKVMLFRTLRWADEKAHALRGMLGVGSEPTEADDEFLDLRHEQEAP